MVFNRPPPAPVRPAAARRPEPRPASEDTAGRKGQQRLPHLGYGHGLKQAAQRRRRLPPFFCTPSTLKSPWASSGRSGNGADLGSTVPHALVACRRRHSRTEIRQWRPPQTVSTNQASPGANGRFPSLPERAVSGTGPSGEAEILPIVSASQKRLESWEELLKNEQWNDRNSV
jgi:hypothetical protein